MKKSVYLIKFDNEKRTITKRDCDFSFLFTNKRSPCLDINVNSLKIIDKPKIKGDLS